MFSPTGMVKPNNFKVALANLNEHHTEGDEKSPAALVNGSILQECVPGQHSVNQEDFESLKRAHMVSGNKNVFYFSPSNSSSKKKETSKFHHLRLLRLVESTDKVQAELQYSCEKEEEAKVAGDESY